MDIRPYQRVVWEIISGIPRGRERWNISTPRLFGKDFLAVKRALQSRRAVIVVPTAQAVEVAFEQLKKAAAGGFLSSMRRGYGYYAVFGEPDCDSDKPTIVITDIQALRGMGKFSFAQDVDFLCFLESMYMDVEPDDALTRDLGHFLAGDAMIVHMGTVPSRMSEDNLFKQNARLRGNYLRVVGPLPNRDYAELAMLREQMTAAMYDADILGLAFWGL